MSTRSYIAKQIDTNKYLTIYCHSDGYLTYNGAMLIDYYNTEEKVDALLKLGNISFLEKKLYPDPGKEHSFDYDKRQEGVVVAYGRDRGDKDSEAFVAAMEDLDDPNIRTAEKRQSHMLTASRLKSFFPKTIRIRIKLNLLIKDIVSKQ